MIMVYFRKTSIWQIVDQDNGDKLIAEGRCGNELNLYQIMDDYRKDGIDVVAIEFIR